MSASLRRGVSLWGVVSLGLGTAMGVALFAIVAPAVALGGPGMLLSVLIAAAPMVAIALCYALIGSVLPTSGASFVWPSRFLHPAIGFGVAWLRIAGTTAAMVVLATVFVRYLERVVALPAKPVIAALFTVVAAANLAGVTIAARLQTALMGLLLGVLALFVGWGAPSVTFARFAPFLPHGLAGVLATVPLLVGLFFGIEAATELGDEVRDDRRAIPLGIGLSLCAAVLAYLLVVIVAIGVAGPAVLAGSDAPLLMAARGFMGPLATPLIVTAALVAIGKSLNALFLVFSRSLFALARAGLLPTALARIDPRRGTPVGAVLTVYALCLAGLLLPSGLTFLFLAVNVPTLLKYAAVCACTDRLVVHHPAVHARAGFRLTARTTRVTAAIGVTAALVIALLGLTADARPYVALVVWALLGIPVWRLRDRSRSHDADPRWNDAS